MCIKLWWYRLAKINSSLLSHISWLASNEFKILGDRQKVDLLPMKSGDGLIFPTGLRSLVFQLNVTVQLDISREMS